MDYIINHNKTGHNFFCFLMYNFLSLKKGVKHVPAVEEFIIKRGKEFGFWIVFHTRYNDICAFKKEIECNSPFDNTDKKYIDTKAREEFLNL